MREQNEQEKQNELLRVIAEQNHEKLIQYDAIEDRALVYAIENGQFILLFDIADYVKENHYGSVFIDPEDKKCFAGRYRHACKRNRRRSLMSTIVEKNETPQWYRFYIVSIADGNGTVYRLVGRLWNIDHEKKYYGAYAPPGRN